MAHEINNPIGFVNSNLKTLESYQNSINELINNYRKLLSDIKNSVVEEDSDAFVARQMGHVVKLETELDIDFLQEDVVDLIQDCQEGVERIKNIIIDLKEFAHPGEDKLKEADINNNIESTLNFVNYELKYKATVVKNYGELPILKCYPQQLNQVFMNILVNASQALEKMGEIRVKTEHVNENIEIMISDNGKGIPEENLSTIFDSFFTTKDVGEGTGLGLNIAHNIVKKHGGSIDVESKVGEGTTFTVKIPVNP